MDDAVDVEDWLARMSDDERVALHELLAIGMKQLDDGLGVPFNADDVIARGRARRAAQQAAE